MQPSPSAPCTTPTHRIFHSNAMPCKPALAPANPMRTRTPRAPRTEPTNNQPSSAQCMGARTAGHCRSHHHWGTTLPHPYLLQRSTTTQRTKACAHQHTGHTHQLCHAWAVCKSRCGKAPPQHKSAAPHNGGRNTPHKDGREHCFARGTSIRQNSKWQARPCTHTHGRAPSPHARAQRPAKVFI